MTDPILQHGPITVCPTRDEDLPRFWEILEAYPDFWADRRQVSGLGDFIAWWQGHVRDAVTASAGDLVVGCGYLDCIYPGHYATINVFRRQDYGNPYLASAVARQMLPYFFERHELEKLVGIVRKGNKAVLRFLRRCGFVVTGLLRHHEQINGVWTDYLWCEILRSEL